jgi:hypothetical protein
VPDNVAIIFNYWQGGHYRVFIPDRPSGWCEYKISPPAGTIVTREVEVTRTERMIVDLESILQQLQESHSVEAAAQHQGEPITIFERRLKELKGTDR